MSITERDFSSQVESLLTLFQWRWMHSRPARVMRHGEETYETAYSGHKGWLDYAATRDGVLLIMEIKSETGKLTKEQKEWVDEWEKVSQYNSNVFVRVFRPSDYESLEETLRFCSTDLVEAREQVKLMEE